MSVNDETARRRLGERLRDAREYLGFSQEEVAKFLGIPRSALSFVESGQRKLDALELSKIAGLYKRPIAFFTEPDYDAGVVDTELTHLARKASELSSDDVVELSKFADYLRARKKMEGQ